VGVYNGLGARITKEVPINNTLSQVLMAKGCASLSNLNFLATALCHEELATV